MEILKLGNGKVVSLSGNKISREEAMEIARKLIDIWGTPYLKQHLV